MKNTICNIFPEVKVKEKGLLVFFLKLVFKKHKNFIYLNKKIYVLNENISNETLFFSMYNASTYYRESKNCGHFKFTMKYFYPQILGLLSMLALFVSFHIYFIHFIIFLMFFYVLRAPFRTEINTRLFCYDILLRKGVGKKIVYEHYVKKYDSWSYWKMNPAFREHHIKYAEMKLIKYTSSNLSNLLSHLLLKSRLP